MLLFALRDAAHGNLRTRGRAAKWIDGTGSAHWAELMGIKEWPPGVDSYNRLRLEFATNKAARGGI